MFVHRYIIPFKLGQQSVTLDRGLGTPAGVKLLGTTKVAFDVKFEDSEPLQPLPCFFTMSRPNFGVTLPEPAGGYLGSVNVGGKVMIFSTCVL